MNGDLGDILGDLIGSQPRETPLQRAARESLANSQKRSTIVPDKPLPQIRGKQIDGVLYVRAEDVADALESQKAAPRLVAKLRRR